MENIFIILLGLSMVYLSSTSRLAAHVNMLMVQGWLLFLICLSGFADEPWFSLSILTNKEALVANSAHLLGLLFVVFETLVIKAYVIPWFLKKVVKKTGGRNAQGKITVRNIGGENRRKYRIIDFKRNKDGVPAKVESIQYDPNRTAYIALLTYADGEKRYIIAPRGLNVGDKVICSNDEHIAQYILNNYIV